MKTDTVFSYKLLLSAFAATALFACAALVPTSASALEVSAQTVQLLPPGQNTCAQIQVNDFTPYVYDGSLNSFEFTVSDPSYVAVVGSVGNMAIPLRYMTRLSDPSGGVRIHVDTDTTPIIGTVPVTITLLSAETGAPVCASVVGVNLGSGISQTGGAASAPTSPTPSYHPAPSTNAGPSSTGGQAGMGATGTTVVPAFAGTFAQNPLKTLCASDASAYRLWLVLLILYALIVGGLLWLEFPLSWAWAKTPERVAGVMLALLVLLLGFWYLSEACRAALWMPLLAFLIAALGLLAAFWNHPSVTRLLIEEKRTVIITPPPEKR